MTTTLRLPRDGYGDAIFTRHADGSVTCDHADPRIRISDVLLHGIAEDPGGAPAAALAFPDSTPVTSKPERPQDLFGAVLTIDCANRRLIYRVTGFEPVWLEYGEWNGSYLAEWPD